MFSEISFQGYKYYESTRNTNIMFGADSYK
jgi:hypothetical protein